MDLSLKPEHKAFADEVRAFARENLSPKDIKASVRTWRPDPYRT